MSHHVFQILISNPAQMRFRMLGLVVTARCAATSSSTTGTDMDLVIDRGLPLLAGLLLLVLVMLPGSLKDWRPVRGSDCFFVCLILAPLEIFYVHDEKE